MTDEGGSGAVRSSGAGYVRPTTAHQAVLVELRKMVINGELAPGIAIRQDEIAERFNVSRVPVREALKMLEGEGHVTYLPHHGFRVTQLTIAELIEIYDMREWLETGLVRASIPRLGRAELATMEDAMAKIAKAAADSDLTTVNEQNRRFHFQLFEPSGLHRAVRTVSQLWDSTDPYRQLYFGDRFNAETVNDDHQAVLEAAFAHDISQTVRLLNLHRGDSVAHLRSLLGDGK